MPVSSARRLKRFFHPRLICTDLVVGVMIVVAWLRPDWAGVPMVSSWRWGLALGALATVLRSWGVLHMNGYLGTLRFGGPFSYLRHPRYLGTFIGFAGACLMINGVWTPLRLAALFILLAILAAGHAGTWRDEENAFLASPKHGPPYRLYAMRVGSICPTWKRYEGPPEMSAAAQQERESKKERIDWANVWTFKVLVGRVALCPLLIAILAWTVWHPRFGEAWILRGWYRMLGVWHR